MQFTATNQIKLGLFKNLHISPSSGQKMACIFGPNWAEKFNGNSGDYYLISIEKSKLG